MKEKMAHVTRRTFLGKSLALGLTSGLAARSGKIHGANERVRVGFIGVGNRGSQLLASFMQNDDCEVAAFCDVYEPYLRRKYSMVAAPVRKALGGRIPKMEEGFGSEVKRYKDFRRLLEDKSIDAVVIATPDHWHAIQTILACSSGKDVYVEKPLSMTITEGRHMVEAAKHYRRVVQVGLQRRSSPVYSRLPAVIRNGDIGRVSVMRAYRVSNMFPDGIGRCKTEDPPPDLDWDLWLGPRAWRPYQANIHPYKFRWWAEYSSQVGNWGVHYFDAIRWAVNEDAPVSVSAHGSHFLDDDRTIPDTMEVTFEFKSGSLLIFGQYEASGGKPIQGGEIELQGTLGTLYANQSDGNSAGYKIVPSRGGQFQKPGRSIDSSEFKVQAKAPTHAHVRNFLDCVKSRETPHCPLEEGHRSTVFAHLANISLDMRMRLEWDPVREKITNSEKANQRLHYAYRSPWTLT